MLAVLRTSAHMGVPNRWPGGHKPKQWVTSRFAGVPMEPMSRRQFLAASGGTVPWLVEKIKNVFEPDIPDFGEEFKTPFSISLPNSKVEPTDWAPNIRALGSVGQRYPAYFEPDGGGSTYSMLLAPLVKQKGGIQEAHAVLQKGYWFRGNKLAPKIVYQRATSSPRVLDCWRVKDNDHTKRTRFALLAGQKAWACFTHFNQAMEKDLQTFSDTLLDNFEMLPNQIQPMKLGDPAHFKLGVEWLAHQIAKTHRESPEKAIDILIYYTGHGNLQKDVAANTPEGVADVEICGTRLMKKEFVDLLNKKLGQYPNPNQPRKTGPVNVLAVFEMCHAGGMVKKPNACKKRA